MRLFFTIALLKMTSGLLRGQEVSEKNDPMKHPTLTNRTFVDKIKGQPIDFYLRHKDIDLPAKKFYKGEYALNDDQETFSFLDSVLTKNVETRPFYLFIYNQAMKVTDGALSEYMASVCRKYLENFPCEFLTKINDNVSKFDADKWTGFIGFDVYDRKTFEKLVTDIDKRINNDCSKRKSDWDKVKLKIRDNLEEQ